MAYTGILDSMTRKNGISWNTPLHEIHDGNYPCINIYGIYWENERTPENLDGILDIIGKIVGCNGISLDELDWDNQ